MRVSIIAAVAKNKAIGKDNDLIWDLPRDMKFFTETTKGRYVIMGRRNYDSIPLKYKPLPKRPNVVVTRQEQFVAEKCDVVNSIAEGLEIARNKGEEEAFVIGGGQIYRNALENKLVDRMYITWIDEEFEADTFFPDFKEEEWEVVNSESFEKDEKNPYNFTIKTYDRK